MCAGEEKGTVENLLIHVRVSTHCRRPRPSAAVLIYTYTNTQEARESARERGRLGARCVFLRESARTRKRQGVGMCTHAGERHSERVHA